MSRSEVTRGAPEPQSAFLPHDRQLAATAARVERTTCVLRTIATRIPPSIIELMRIREAQPGDASSLAAVHVTSWRAAYRGLLPQTYLAGLDTTQRSKGWQHILARTDWPNAGTWLAEDDGAAVGFVNFCPTRDQDESELVRGEVTAIYVLPQYWGRGTGTRLMEAALRSLTDAGCSQATLWVLGSNARARRYYDESSWRADGASKQDDSHSIWLSEIRYVRDLI